MIATCRALGVKARKPKSDSSFAIASCYSHGAMLVYQWPQPDGAPDNAKAWTGVSRMLSSFEMHWGIGAGWWPREDVGHRKPASWLPAKSLRFDDFVDHLSRTWLGRKASARVIDAACTSLNTTRSAIVDVNSQVITWQFPRLYGVLLDSPSS